MYDRFLIQLPKKATPSKDEIRLAQVLGKLDGAFAVNLHKELFLNPINYTNIKGSLVWKNSSMRTSHKKDPQIILKRNVYNISRNLGNLGLLMTQLTWSGILKINEKCIIMRQSNDLCRAVELMCIVLGKDANMFCRFMSALRMTDNTEVANVLEVHERELCKKEQFQSTSRKTAARRSAVEDCTDESYPISEPSSPMKKRKTSSDSGIDEDITSTVDNSENASVATKNTTKSMPIEIPPKIAIQKGCEDTLSSVVLCKCGDYHQFPKWKLMSATPKKSSEQNDKRSDTSSKRCPRTILHPVTSVEVGCDYLDLDSLEQSSRFTKPRRSCEFHKLRFHGSCKPGDCSEEVREQKRVRFQVIPDNRCVSPADNISVVIPQDSSCTKVKKEHPFSRLLRAFM